MGLEIDEYLKDRGDYSFGGDGDLLFLPEGVVRGEKKDVTGFERSYIVLGSEVVVTPLLKTVQMSRYLVYQALTSSNTAELFLKILDDVRAVKRDLMRVLENENVFTVSISPVSGKFLLNVKGKETMYEYGNLLDLTPTSGSPAIRIDDNVFVDMVMAGAITSLDDYEKNNKPGKVWGGDLPEYRKNKAWFDLTPDQHEAVWQVINI